MTGTAQRALHLWWMAGADCVLVAARENRVYRVDLDGSTYALRLHRQGLRSDAELKSELLWVSELAKGGVTVPASLPTKDGALLAKVDDVQVDLISWMSGAPMGQTGARLNQSVGPGLFYEIGVSAAKIHDISDGWDLPADFDRGNWDRAALLGADPAWGRFWENPTLGDADRTLFQNIRRALDADLAAIEDRLDFGLIHADLVRENIMLDENRIGIIDFDDSCFGFRLFELATALHKNMDEPNYEDLKSSLIQGYQTIRPIEVAWLDMFILLRSLTYVGWIVDKIQENGGAERNERFISNAAALSRSYLKNRNSQEGKETA